MLLGVIQLMSYFLILFDPTSKKRSANTKIVLRYTHNIIVAERRSMHLILIAIAVCRRKKGAIACVCFLFALAMFVPILFYFHICTRIFNFSASGNNLFQSHQSETMVEMAFRDNLSSVPPHSFGNCG